jgi:hypothetical protein
LSSVHTTGQAESPVAYEGLFFAALRLVDLGLTSLLACMSDGQIVQYTLESSEDRVVILRGSLPHGSKPRMRKTSHIAYLCDANGSLQKRLITEQRRLSRKRLTWKQAEFEAHEAEELYGMLNAYRQLDRV